MDEKTAYEWTAECLKPIEGLVEPHRLQQAADKVAAAILEAARHQEHKEAMTLNEFVKTGLTRLIAEAARLAANETDSPDEAAAIPLGFFAIEMKLQRTWDEAVREAAGEQRRETAESHEAAL